ncbi:hypothetical protein [Azospirillum canadense]|uniref:hypothetical protein n=1 Tax=Azospirillum canadense TaxID=403962 RepID=UPI002225EBC0|nr:hypothetical protein [Azospirillum canadense]MCW2243498.1 plasmid stability protein [Azospirillum canadense]
MGKIVLENIEEDTLDRLRALASSTGRTPEEEAKFLIADALSRSQEERGRREALLRRMREISSMSPPVRGVDMTDLIREDRDR